MNELLRAIDIESYQDRERLEETANSIQRRIKDRIEGLCGSCQHAFIYRTKRQNSPVVLCEWGKSKPVPHDIIECNKYTQMGQLDIATLAKLATHIDKDKKDQAGFKVHILGKEE